MDVGSGDEGAPGRSRPSVRRANPGAALAVAVAGQSAVKKNAGLASKLRRHRSLNSSTFRFVRPVPWQCAHGSPTP